MNESDLLQLAAAQHGYFSTSQAAAAGISRRALVDRVRRGVIERAAHGVYRLSGTPATQLDSFYAFSVEAPSATFSHDTALELYGVSDVLPRTVHVTVPPGSGLKPRRGYTIHRSVLAPSERVLRDGVWVTSLVRTLTDCAKGGTDPEQLLAALSEGRERALLTPDDISRLRRRYPFTTARP
ncbi:MAG TPA: type IV toxin-antitoxin system AbiEi family antitoxin domain-containing protein [Propionicimonas sp.]|jgi:predicted transcriptional regulator of viral defense system